MEEKLNLIINQLGKMQHGIDKLEKNQIRFEEKLNIFESKLNQFGERQNDFEKKLDQFGKRQDGFEKKLDQFGKRQDGFEKKLDQFGKRQDGFEKKLAQFGDRQARFEKKLDYVVNSVEVLAINHAKLLQNQETFNTKLDNFTSETRSHFKHVQFQLDTHTNTIKNVTILTD